MRIYVAGPLLQIEKSKALAQKIRENGQQIVSHWHDYDFANGPIPSQQQAFDENMHDVDICQILIASTFPYHGRETYIEIGRALHQMKTVLWIPREGGECLSLLNSPLVRRFEADEDAIAYINDLDFAHYP